MRRHHPVLSNYERDSIISFWKKESPLVYYQFDKHISYFTLKGFINWLNHCNKVECLQLLKKLMVELKRSYRVINLNEFYHGNFDDLVCIYFLEKGEFLIYCQDCDEYYSSQALEPETWESYHLGSLVSAKDQGYRCNAEHILIATELWVS